MIEALDQVIREKIQASQKILVATHIRPDGDAIGSLLGLGIALRQSGKAVQMVSVDGIPANYRHLPGSQDVLKDPDGPVDLAIVVDCSDLGRVGKSLAGRQVPDINIDHHVTNSRFASLNLIVPSAVATTEILADRLPEWGLSISTQVATALLTGLITDTLGFRTANLTPKAMRLAADLMEAGAELPELYMRALVLHSYEAVRFWGAGLSRLERENGIVWTALTKEDRKAAGYPGRDDADLINILSAIDGAMISIIFVEQTKGSVKVSWRSQPGIDVSSVAVKLGGGGHPSAAGADLKGSLDEVRAQVLDETRRLIHQQMTV